MKLKPEKSASKRRCKPFLILPVLSPDHLVHPGTKMVKNPGLKLFTKTWPPRRENAQTTGKGEQSRPLTATLEKPTILDIKFVGKVDMSKVRKEFLNISNLCRMPLLAKKRPGKSKICRPLSFPATANGKKKKKAATSGEDSWEDEESTRSSGRRSVSKNTPTPALPNNKPKIALNNKLNSALNSKLNGSLNNKLNSKPNGKLSKAVASDANNNTRRRPAVAGPPSTKLPEPCTTCGRPDLPERFHSHPPAQPTARRSVPKEKEAIARVPVVKSTVQKPVAIRYKSKQHNDDKKPPLLRKPSLPSQVLVHTPPAPLEKPQKPPSSAMGRVKSAKRTLTCYICGREFGTASLPLHEPKCLEKFQRENAVLPLHLRRKLPPKPDGSVSQEEWNRLAWESSQSTLTPCANCGRTFYPDRLVVHQRSCKTPLHNPRHIPPTVGPLVPPPLQSMAQRTSPSQEGPKSPASHQPPTVECYICGRPFGTHSIGIHERQCLRKWHQENDALPRDMQSTPPVKSTNGTKAKPAESADSQPARTSSTDAPDRQADRSSSGAGRRPPLFPCYLCGKLFSVHSIYLHEPQCLKRWQVENDKLLPGKRRPVPLKPDIKFTQDGGIDFEATNDANWQSHLSQLVPCKFCSRKFNPDRVVVHERSCKRN